MTTATAEAIKTTEVQSVEYIQQYRFRLVGQSPLLMHWDNIEWADQMEAIRTRIKETDKTNFKAGDDRCPPETWKGYTYNDGKHLVIPNDNLRACMLKASARVTLSGKKTYKELSQCGLLFDELFIPFFDHGKQIEWAAIDAIAGSFRDHTVAVEKLGFRLLVKRAKVGTAKHVRVRALFTEWSAAGTFTVINAQLTEDVVAKIWAIAGVYIGMCDWRPGSPASPGPYGRFVTELEKV